MSPHPWPTCAHLFVVYVSCPVTFVSTHVPTIIHLCLPFIHLCLYVCPPMDLSVPICVSLVPCLLWACDSYTGV